MTESLSNREEMKLLPQSLLGFHWASRAAEELAASQAGMSAVSPTSHIVLGWFVGWVCG